MKRGEYDQARSNRSKRIPRKRLLVVTEGVVTEKEYFERLKVFLDLKKPQLDVHVECSPNYEGTNPTAVVRSAKKLRDEAREKQVQQDQLGNLEAREEYDEVWVVFDTERYGKNKDLMPAAEVAAKQEIKVAISRPSFESWFLLHLRDGLPAMETCNDVCNKISAETKKIYKREYHKDSHKNQDLLWLIETILPMTKEAIARGAKVAVNAFADHEHVPSSSGTKVHELVRTLWEASPKGSRESAIEK